MLEIYREDLIPLQDAAEAFYNDHKQDFELFPDSFAIRKEDFQQWCVDAKLVQAPRSHDSRTNEWKGFKTLIQQVITTINRYAEEPGEERPAFRIEVIWEKTVRAETRKQNYSVVPYQKYAERKGLKSASRIHTFLENKYYDLQLLHTALNDKRDRIEPVSYEMLTDKLSDLEDMLADDYAKYEKKAIQIKSWLDRANGHSAEEYFGIKDGEENAS